MLEHSRSLRLAAAVANSTASDLERRLGASTIVVSVDSMLPGAMHCAQVLVASLRRLPISLSLEPSHLSTADSDRLVEVATEVDPARAISVARVAGSDVVRLHVGPTAPQGVIRVVPDGFGAQVATDPAAGLRQHRAPYATGTVLAAAFGAAEAFKRLVAATGVRARPHGHLSYCPVTLSTDLTAAPDLIGTLQLDAMLIGLGAIGTATALILGELNAEGTLALVDPEVYAPENRGTYSLGTQTDVEAATPKVAVVARAIEHRFDVRPWRRFAEELPGMIDGGVIGWPKAVLTGLDSIQARHAAQHIWPDHLIDGATGDTMLGLSVVEGVGRPCLMCFYPPRPGATSSAERLAAATGLTVARAARGGEPLSESDIAGLRDEKRRMLQPHLGRPVCGLLQALGLTEIDAGDYQPAVPFVSQQAAASVVGRLLAQHLGIATLPNFIQYDALAGPGRATHEARRSREGCECISRGEIIARVRAVRRAATNHTVEGQ
jgi:hypothetical protein